MTDTAKPTPKRIEIVHCLGAQAMDAYDATGLTPRQLVERVKELEDTLCRLCVVR